VKNSRSILVLLLAILLLTFAHVAVRSCGDGRRVHRRQSLLEQVGPVSAVKIERRGSAPLLIRRGEETGWRIVEPFAGRADERTVTRLIDVLSFTPIIDTVADSELVRLGRTQSDFSLDEPPVRVTVDTGKDRNVLSFVVPTPTADGVYASIDGLGAVFVVPMDVLSASDHPVEDFRRRAVFTGTIGSVTSFSLRQGTGANLSFVRVNDGWRVDGDRASKAKVDEFLDSVLTSEAVCFVWPVGASNETERVSSSLLAGYGLDPENAVIVTLKGLDGEDGQVSLGKAADPGLVYASIQNGGAVVMVRESLRTAALQTKAAFADSRLFPVEESAVSFFRLVDGEEACVLARTEDGRWRVEAPVSAPADPSVVHRVLTRLLALPATAVTAETSGFSVSMSAETPPVFVSRRSVLAEDRLDDLRSLEMVRIESKDVKRLVRSSGEKGAESVAVVRGREGGSWTVEASADGFSVRPEGIEKVLASLNPLVATRVERLKVSAADLDGYGLGRPFLTIAIDLERENAVRRNILVGAKTVGGRFATIGSSDAVFVVPEKTVELLASQPVGR